MGLGRMLITKNWEERSQAEKLGMAMPKAVQEKTDLLFYNRDVKRSFVGDEGSIILVMNDDANLEIEYDEKIWKGLKIYFKEHED